MVDKPNDQKPATHWVVELETDPETGDLIMPLPMELLEQQGWQIGDVLNWDVDPETQEVTLTKKSHDENQHKP